VSDARPAKADKGTPAGGGRSAAGRAPAARPDSGVPMPRITRPSSEDRGDRPAAVPTLTESRFSQSLERGLAILECFTPGRPVWGIAELAEELGMSRSTTHRYSLTLTELGYLERAPERKYRLGLDVTRLGMTALAGTPLEVHARPYLEELRRQTSYTVAVAVLDGPDIIVVECVHSVRRAGSDVDRALAVGARLPAHRTAMGKALLAGLEEWAAKSVVGELDLSRHTPKAIAGKRALAQELAAIREDGVACGDEELVEGLVEIAAPVRGESREVVAAVGMAAPASRIALDSLVEHLAPHVTSTADRISALLGYRRKDERRDGYTAPDTGAGE
jgi:IclR family transcriptional regulator, pca regulon regulatory protein